MASAAAPGSAGNVLAALASFVIPGLGQLAQGRPFSALAIFLLAALGWLVLLGWFFHLLAALDAAMYRPKPARTRATIPPKPEGEWFTPASRS